MKIAALLKRGAVKKGERVALLAGQGDFAVGVAKELHRLGAWVLVISVEREESNVFASWADEVIEVRVSEGAKALNAAKSRKIRKVVLVGKIVKRKIYEPGFKPDDVSDRVLRTAGREKGDHRILMALSALLRVNGMRAVGVHELIPGWVTPAGALGRLRPDKAMQEDIRVGLRQAKAVGRLDIGQAVAVKNGTVIAVEGIEGTDAMIERVGALGIKGAVLVKVAKPQQDLRFDMPVIGLETLKKASAASFSAVCGEKNRTLMTDAGTMKLEADRLGLVLAGV